MDEPGTDAIPVTNSSIQIVELKRNPKLETGSSTGSSSASADSSDSDSSSDSSGPRRRRPKMRPSREMRERDRVWKEF